jgi:hypothetical protein
MKSFLFFTFYFFIGFAAFAQVPRIKKPITTINNNLNDNIISNNQNTNPINPQTKKSSDPKNDSLGFEHRDDSKDIISINFRLIDSVNKNKLDSTIDDFTKYFSVPFNYIYLGNNGAAAAPLVFEPMKKVGFDPGFHAFDVYKFSIQGTKFYNTSKAFSSLSYQLASGKEQMLKAGVTKNIRPNFNLGFDYKLINAPGFFVSQNTNHNAFRLFGNYRGKTKRYGFEFSVLGNNIRASENGGIQNEEYLSDPYRKNRFAVPVNLGGLSAYKNSPFLTTITTGNQQRDFNVLVRQSYDFGKKDSVEINDTTTEYLFYPKLRFQHTFTYSNQSYKFIDNVADSAIYSKWYHLNFASSVNSILYQESWRIMNNDFSIIQFPDTKNTSQYFQAGATIQNISGGSDSLNYLFHNLSLHAEYRNLTRNKLWDILAKGEYYLNGLNSGDYSVQINLSRSFGKRWGNVGIYFINNNRTPSFVFDNRSAFHLDNNNSFKKENNITFGINSDNPILNFEFKNHLLTNYTYFKNYYQAEQYSKIINLAQLVVSKKVKLSKRWNWMSEITLQQTDLAAPIRVPLLFTRNRIAYEGRFFKNLILSTGIEARYYSNYKANNYSPLISQFTFQDTVNIKNIPDINLFVHFRIRGFAGYLRAENLNTASFKNGFSWTNNNFAAPLYPTQGFMIRFGIQWWFVN